MNLPRTHETPRRSASPARRAAKRVDRARHPALIRDVASRHRPRSARSRGKLVAYEPNQPSAIFCVGKDPQGARCTRGIAVLEHMVPAPVAPSGNPAPLLAQKLELLQLRPQDPLAAKKARTSIPLASTTSLCILSVYAQTNGCPSASPRRRALRAGAGRRSGFREFASARVMARAQWVVPMAAPPRDDTDASACIRRLLEAFAARFRAVVPLPRKSDEGTRRPQIEDSGPPKSSAAVRPMRGPVNPRLIVPNRLKPAVAPT